MGDAILDHMIQELVNCVHLLLPIMLARIVGILMEDANDAIIHIILIIVRSNALVAQLIVLTAPAPRIVMVAILAI